MAAFKVMLYSIVNFKQNVNKMRYKYIKRRNDKSTEQIFTLFLNVLLIKRLCIIFTTVSTNRIEAI